MATIDKRVGKNSSVTWRARVRVQGQTRVATFKRKTDATSWATNTEADLNKGKHVPTRAEMRRTVSEAVDWYIDDYLPTKRRNKDRANPKRHLDKGEGVHDVSSHSYKFHRHDDRVFAARYVSRACRSGWQLRCTIKVLAMTLH